MKSFIYRYHLREGILIALIFPTLFIVSDKNDSYIISRFLSSFLIIFFLWLTNFMLVDFTTERPVKKVRHFPGRFISITLSFFSSVIIYISIALLLDRSESLLAPAFGNESNTFLPWFYLCIKIFVFDALIILIKYLFHSNAEKRRIAIENELLKLENLNATHEILKQQVNPHFLFNSLNTLRSLTRRSPEQAVEFVTELSSVYRYMLQHQDQKMVKIEDEISFVNSYLYLMHIRFDSAIDTRIEIPEYLLNHTMPPNTLQLLVENAVKHNSFSSRHPLKISIYIDDGYLVVENNLQQKTVREGSSKLGLKNICNRYLLLMAKDVLIEQKENVFRVSLPLN